MEFTRYLYMKTCNCRLENIFTLLQDLTMHGFHKYWTFTCKTETFKDTPIKTQWRHYLLLQLTSIPVEFSNLKLLLLLRVKYK